MWCIASSLETVYVQDTFESLSGQDEDQTEICPCTYLGDPLASILERPV